LEENVFNTLLMKEGRQRWGSLVRLGSISLAGGILAIFQAVCITQLVDLAFLQHVSLAGLTFWFALVLPVIIFRASLLWLGEKVGFQLADGVKTALRQQVLGHLFSLGPVFAGREHAGELVNTLGGGIENLEAYFAKYLPQLLTGVIVPPVILVAVLSNDGVVALIMLVTAPLIPVFMLLIGSRASQLQKQQWEVLSRLSGHFFDVLQGLITLKIFNRSREQAAVIARLSDQFRNSTLKVLRIAFLSALTLELLATLSTALVAVTVGLKLLYGGLVFKQAFFVLLLAPEYYLPLRLLGSQFHAGLAGKIAGERLYQLLAIQPEAILETGRLFKPSGPVGLEFRQVSYTYIGAVQQAISSVSFTIGPGQQVALVGASAAGKSTLADMVLGFIQPQAGKIFVQGQDLTTIPLRDWRKQLVYIPQFPQLFYGTIKENILFGTEAEQAAVEKAAQAAEIHEFIVGLPEQYDTVIGQGGLGLSGGEAQRLAIARAFIRQGPVVVLDEPMSGLDPRNERLIRQALNRLLAGKTVLIIAHRLSTASRADKVVVLEGGRVVEEGTHHQLLDKQGRYYRLVKGKGG
jgi:ATP-binding cassette subfamily C protein CydD